MAKEEKRKVTYGRKRRDYNPSGTELLLEEVCSSFGTELGQAEIASQTGLALLVRVAKPVLATHKDGSRRIVQVQYTRFSPLRSGKALETYAANRSSRRGKRETTTENEIRAQHKPWDAIAEVTDNKYIKGLPVFRWDEALYFAVYAIGENETVKDMTPNRIYSADTTINTSSGVRLPQLHITFTRPAMYDKGLNSINRDVKDTLRFDLPEARALHEESYRAAISQYNLREGGEDRFVFRSCGYGAEYEISPDVERGRTMGMILTYLNQLCKGTTFN